MPRYLVEIRERVLPMQRKAVFWFIIGTFFITWSAWVAAIFLVDGALVPGSPAYALYGLGGLLGPIIPAFIVMRFINKKEAFRPFLRELIKAKVSFYWYAAVILFPLLLGLLPYLLELISDGTFKFTFTSPYYTVFLLLPMMIIGGGLEEVGWRGVLLPELLKRFSPLTSTLMVSLVWALWHAPLWFIPGTVQSELSMAWFALSLLGSSFLLSAVYINTRSVFLCILLHALFNANAMYFEPVVPLNSWSEEGSIVVKLILCTVSFLLLVNKKEAKRLAVASGREIGH